MKVTWTSPSNIALVKYWGKHGVQLPCNPSISFTLSNSITKTTIEIVNSSCGLNTRFSFEGNTQIKFKEKIDKFLLSIVEKFPWISSNELIINSENSFPHSAGIASSASSMSALCLCLLNLDELLTGNKRSHESFYKEASELSRLASGSACRSLYSGIVVWGKNDLVKNARDEYSLKITNIHPLFNDFCDSILIVDSNEKAVSSRAGHSLMNNHPYAQSRYIQARENLSLILKSIEMGDLDSFIKIVEIEALSLHGLMMSSNPSYILLRPKSLAIIEKIRDFRNSSKLPICFTIDAGPNIHLLYPNSIKTQIRKWIQQELVSVEKISCLHDEVGNGPQKIEEVC